MPYVTRNTEGEIISIAHEAQSIDHEHVDSKSQDFMSFLDKTISEEDAALHALNQSDRDVARITEDLINLLIQKNLIVFTELPNAVQRKILEREKLRSQLNSNPSNFLDEDESI